VSKKSIDPENGALEVVLDGHSKVIYRIRPNGKVDVRDVPRPLSIARWILLIGVAFAIFFLLSWARTGDVVLTAILIPVGIVITALGSLALYLLFRLVEWSSKWIDWDR
jgi:hypothetical protein